MPLIKIDDIDFNSEDLTENGKKLLDLIGFVDAKITNLNKEISLKKIAQKSYELELRRLVTKRLK